MKKIRMAATLALAGMTLAGCSYHIEHLDPTTDPVEKPFNSFDFSTTNDSVQVNLAYDLQVKAPIYFELYDEEPGAWADNGQYYKREDALPLYAGYTDGEGKFSDKLSLPAYVTRLYAYTPAFIATSIMDAEVNGKSVTFTDPVSTWAGTRSTRAGMADNTNFSFMTCPVENIKDKYASYKLEKRWFDWLVTYDNKGRVQNRFEGSATMPAITEDKIAEYVKSHLAVFPITNRSKYPTDYICKDDIELTQNTELAITCIGGNTCWNSSLGYYYYPIGQEPKSLNDVNVVMTFPNTQNGGIVANKYNGTYTMGTHAGDCVKLKYYPNIASGSKEGATDVFPAGIKLGFVLVPNAWSEKTKKDYDKDRKQRSSTSPFISRNLNGEAMYDKSNNLISMAAWYEQDGKILISFEDDNDYDHSYSDFIIAFQANPALPNRPAPIPAYRRDTVETNIGVYAFEDQWPLKGDYDLNDVMFTSKHYKVMSSENQGVYEQGYIYKIYANEAHREILPSGLAVITHQVYATDTLRLYVRRHGEKDFKEASLTYDAKNKLAYLTDNVHDEVGTEFRLSIYHKADYSLQNKGRAWIQPVIYRYVDGKYLEIGVTGNEPSGLADRSFFGTQDDCSVLTSKIYYVREGNYPFSFFLDNGTEKDIEKLMKAENESRCISEIYPYYDEWVTSNGEDAKDWYKK